MNSEQTYLIRKEFAHLSTIYFNSAYFGPSPFRAKIKIEKAMQKELDPSFYDYNTWMGISERTRLQFAQLIDTSADNITHASSTSDIINIVANGYDFKSGDVVAAIDGDYPSNVLPWMVAQKNYPVKLELLKCDFPDVAWLEKNIPKNTKIFNTSWVTFDSGRKIDLLSVGKWLKSRNILFVVDATQALGGLHISRDELSYVDVLATSSYKWMLGPYGHAFGYFSDNAQKLIKHKTGNWIVSPNSKVVYNLCDYTTETLPGARKYDRGQASNNLSSACLTGALEFLSEMGLKNIQDHNHALRDYFLQNFPKNKYDVVTPPDHMANIISIKGKTIDPLLLETELKHHNIDVSVRQGKVRLSFHVFNTKSEVDTLIRALDI